MSCQFRDARLDGILDHVTEYRGPSRLADPVYSAQRLEFQRVIHERFQKHDVRRAQQVQAGTLRFGMQEKDVDARIGPESLYCRRALFAFAV